MRESELPLNKVELFVQQYPNRRPFSDGDIFRNVRLCAKSGDITGEEMWRARLTTEHNRQGQGSQEVTEDVGVLLRLPFVFMVT